MLIMISLLFTVGRNQSVYSSYMKTLKVHDLRIRKCRKIVPRFGPGVAEGANLTKGEGEDTTVSNMMTYGRIVNPSEKF